MRNEELFEKYFLEALSPSETQELKLWLKESEEARRQIAHFTRERSILIQVAGRIKESTGAGRVARPRITSARIIWIAAACAVVLVCVTLFLQKPAAPVKTDAPLARLDRVSGEAYIIAASKKTRAKSGDPLFKGQGLEALGRESLVVVKYSDDTRIEVGGGSSIGELAASSDGGKKVLLSHGALAAEVCPQPQHRPMIVVTAHAEVKVLGTRLKVSCTRLTTRVEVDAGLVELVRLSDGRSAQVETGHYAVVVPGLELKQELMQPAGLASKYLGDLGIEKDPAVIFHENFESGDTKKWDDVSGQVAVIDEKPHAGAKCVKMEVRRDAIKGGAIKWFKPGADAVYARFYVKFSADYQYLQRFVSLSANPANDKWRSFGVMGKKCDGTFYSTHMQPWFGGGKNPSPGELTFYSYCLDLEPEQKGGVEFFPKGPERGEAAGLDRFIPPLDRWQCWEFMIQPNSSPDKSDGKQAMWVDGELVGEFTGIRWRSTMDLKVNCLWLLHYNYEASDPAKEFWKDRQAVWFDDVVVAQRYIGPMKER